MKTLPCRARMPRTAVALTRCTILLAAMALGACATRLGPKTIPAARFDYNERIARSQNEQLLLNLVRLRYRDTPVFLDVGTVIAQYTLDARVDLLPSLNVEETGGAGLGADLGGAYSEQPTITYEPISGAEFTRRLLTPIPPQTIILLSQSGWSIERLLMCCVEAINGVSNAPVASGPTPDRIPDNSQFRGVAERLRELQLSGSLDFMMAQEQDEDAPTALLRIAKPDGGDPRADLLRSIRETLRLDAEVETFHLAPRRPQRGKDEIVMTGRSVLGALFFLSHNVDPPDSHKSRGWVTVAKGLDGEDGSWRTVSGDLLRIAAEESEPSGAFVRIRYRGHWFYIDDSDLNSKATFNLLTYLLSLQSAGQEGINALLTVPVGK